jgi:hypothetical protein
MSRFNSFVALNFAATGLAILLPAAAMADTKVYQAASVCRGIGTIATTSGAIQNVSFANPIFAYCAINLDRTDAAPTSVQVTVVDNSSLAVGDGNFTCRLIPINKAGKAGSEGSASTTNGTNSNGTTLTLAVPAGVTVDGTLTLKCRIPRRGAGDPVSTVASIKVVEPDPGN